MRKPMLPEPFLLGVLGGMGPLATADFLRQLVLATPAQSDQEHVPAIVWNVPQIADRQRALAGGGPSPLPQMLEIVAQLNRLGCTCIAMPCNTAHHWADALQAASDAPLLHIVDATLEMLRAGDLADGAAVGLIATRATLRTRLYQDRLAGHGLRVLENTEAELDAWFTPGCYAVKRNALEEGARLFEQAARSLLERGAQRLILACTEVPPALAHRNPALLDLAVDPGQALARAVVARYLSAQSGFPADQCNESV